MTESIKFFIDYIYLRDDVVEYKRHGVASRDEMLQIEIKIITVLLRDIWCLRGYIMAMYLQQTGKRRLLIILVATRKNSGNLWQSSLHCRYSFLILQFLRI